MDKKYLNKVADQIASETIVHWNNERKWWMVYFSGIHISYLYITLPFPTLSPSSPKSHILFSKHCEEIYGLTKDEVLYVWREYRNIIIDKTYKMESLRDE